MISLRKLCVSRMYRYAKRYGEILNVLIKYGFGDLADALNIKQQIGIEKISPRKKSSALSTKHAPWSTICGKRVSTSGHGEQAAALREE